MPPRREADLPPANRIFVDREDPQGVFERAAFAIPADRPIVRVFHGVGGQGKTALCRELLRKADAAVDPAWAFLRRAHLDLHGRPKTDPDLLLVWIRNAFADAGVACPCFDLALALMWEGTRGEQPFPNLSNPWLGRATKAAKGAADEGASDAADWLKSDAAKELIGDAVGEIPFAGTIFKRLGAWAIDKGKQAWLHRTRDQLKRLYHEGDLKPAYEISLLLPWMLAQDLNHHLAHHPADRFALFVDEYERVFDQGGAGAHWRENPFDRHLRGLVQEANGLLVTFFTRERLPWAEDPDWRADLDGHQHALGGLLDADSDAFLQAVPIADEAVRRAIVDGARERADATAPVYPLMLDLQVEHWRHLSAAGQVAPERFHVGADTFEGRCIEIIERVLRDYGEPLQTTVERLSVAQRFDRAAFDFVIDRFGTALPHDSFERIADLSFVSRSEDGFLTLHNVVAAALRKRLSEERRETSLAALLEHYVGRAKVSTHFELNVRKLAALNEAAFLRRMQGTNGYIGWLEVMSEPIRMSAHYDTFAILWRVATDFIENRLGTAHLDTAATYNHLAIALNHQGKFIEAEIFYRKALEIRERVLGRETPEVAHSLDNIASNLQDQGRMNEAEPLYGDALAIRARVLGMHHPDTAASFNNVGSCLHALGQFVEAESHYRKALAIRKVELGYEHPDTAGSINNVAYNLDAQGRSAEAEPLYREALAIRKSVLGPNHPDTAGTVNNLAMNLQSQARADEAEPLLRESLNIFELILGQDHPLTIKGINNVAFNLSEQGRTFEAGSLFQRALEISDRVLGAEHPLTVTTMHNFATNLHLQGRIAESEPLLRKVVEVRENIIGIHHLETGISYNNLATNLDVQGKYPEAKSFYDKAFSICEHILGLDHPNTQHIRSKLSALEGNGNLHH